MHVSRSAAALLAAILIVGFSATACRDDRSPNLTEPLTRTQLPDSAAPVLIPHAATVGCVHNTPQGSYPDPRANCVEVFGVSTINIGERQTFDCHGWGPVQIGTTVQSYPVAAGHPSSWSASPSGIVTVDKQSTDYTAIVTGVAPGGATVNCYIDGVAGGISVTVNGVRTLQSIFLTPATYSLYPGQQVQETPHFVDNYGQTDKITPTPTVTWASDNQAIATVSSTGRVTASTNPAASGIAHIRATSGSITSSPATITVIPKTVVPVTITGPAQPIGITGSYTWTATPQTSDTYTYVWEYQAAGSGTWQTVGTNSRTYTRTLAANDPDFTLRVTLNSVTRTGSATLFVNLGQPLEAPLAAFIDGPSYIDQLGSYAWTATTVGGVAPLSYRWQINYLLRPTWGGIGTNSSSVSFMVSPDDGSFQLRLTVTSATGRQAAVADYQITVAGGSGCGTKFIC